MQDESSSITQRICTCGEAENYPLERKGMSLERKGMSLKQIFFHVDRKAMFVICQYHLFKSRLQVIRFEIASPKCYNIP